MWRCVVTLTMAEVGVLTASEHSSMETPDYFDIQRCLCILRRLQIGPARRNDLMDHAFVELGTGAYHEDKLRAVKQFGRDIARLRSWGVEIVVATGHVYTLNGYGDFSPVALPNAALNTLAFLWVTFDPTAPNGEAVRVLLQRILDWLPSRQREQVGTERQRLQLDLRRRDRDVLDQQVFDILGRAYRERWRLRFLYRAPGNADGLPRRHTVEPWEPPEFEAGRGHYYLRAYCSEPAYAWSICYMPCDCAVRR